MFMNETAGQLVNTYVGAYTHYIPMYIYMHIQLYTLYT